MCCVCVCVARVCGARLRVCMCVARVYVVRACARVDKQKKRRPIGTPKKFTLEKYPRLSCLNDTQYFDHFDFIDSLDDIEL